MLRSYPGKILLFGEYSLLYGSKGLVMPYEQYIGEWKFEDVATVTPDLDLKQFHDFSSKELSNIKFNWSLFKHDIEKGLVFSSSIPKGEGLGSSGALVAAFYDRYALNQTTSENHGVDLNVIRHDLAQLESYHHQKSSGFDPMVSWLQRPILLNGLDDMVVLNQLDGHAQWLEDNNLNVFLLPTHHPRKTAEWVDKFRIKLNQQKFNHWFENIYCSLVNNCVDAFLNMNEIFFKEIFVLCHEQEIKLSEFMDLPIIHQLKNDFIAKADCTLGLKLCGAGGGGHFLVFCKTKFVQKNFMQDLELKYNLIKVL